LAEPLARVAPAPAACVVGLAAAFAEPFSEAVIVAWTVEVMKVGS
jgi:hypothetical protein